jgi:hypothetical protein
VEAVDLARTAQILDFVAGAKYAVHDGILAT